MIVKRWRCGLVFILFVLAVGLVAGCAGDRGQAGGAVAEDGGQAVAGTEQKGAEKKAGAGTAETAASGMKLELESVDSLSPDEVWQGDGLALGKPAPDLTLTGLDGMTYRLRDLLGEKPAVINFWASWCPPCELEAPDLVYLSEKYKDDVVFLGVNMTNQDTPADAKAFVERHGYRFPILLDEKGTASRDWQVLSIPTTYFIDRNGTIQYKLLGVTTRGRLEAMVQNLLETKQIY